MTVDPNPIYDSGSPCCTAGTNSAARLCDLLEIDLTMHAPREEMVHGWGEQGLGAESFVGCWELTIFDQEQRPCTILFDLLPGNSSIIIGLDIGKYAIQNNIADSPFICFCRPHHSSPRTFSTYIAADPNKPRCNRIRVEIIPRLSNYITSLASSTLHNRIKRAPKLFAKRVHRLTHAPSEQIKGVCDDAGVLTQALETAIDNVGAACGICAQSGKPAPTNKISLTHVNERFNMEILMDFAFEEVRGSKRTILIITDAGTAFSEGTISRSKDMATVCSKLEFLWITRHGAPVALAADDEYNRRNSGRCWKCTESYSGHDQLGGTTKRGEWKEKSRPLRRSFDVWTRNLLPPLLRTS